MSLHPTYQLLIRFRLLPSHRLIVLTVRLLQGLWVGDYAAIPHVLDYPHRILKYSRLKGLRLHPLCDNSLACTITVAYPAMLSLYPPVPTGTIT